MTASTITGIDPRRTTATGPTWRKLTLLATHLVAAAIVIPALSGRLDVAGRDPE